MRYIWEQKTKGKGLASCGSRTSGPFLWAWREEGRQRLRLLRDALSCSTTLCSALISYQDPCVQKDTLTQAHLLLSSCWLGSYIFGAVLPDLSAASIPSHPGLCWAMSRVASQAQQDFGSATQVVMPHYLLSKMNKETFISNEIIVTFLFLDVSLNSMYRPLI